MIMSSQKSKTSQKIHVIGGGTITHIRSHLALCAVAYGATAKKIHQTLEKNDHDVTLPLTKMASAGASDIETNDDVSDLIDKLLKDTETKVIIFNPAITDFHGKIGDVPSGKYAERLSSRESEGATITLSMADKIVGRIRKERPDIIIVAFKTTANEDSKAQIKKGNRLIEQTGANIVLANDTGTRNNIVLFSAPLPNDALYEPKPSVITETKNRDDALSALVTTLELLLERTKTLKKNPRYKKDKRQKLRL